MSKSLVILGLVIILEGSAKGLRSWSGFESTRNLFSVGKLKVNEAKVVLGNQGGFSEEGFTAFVHAHRAAGAPGSRIDQEQRSETCRSVGKKLISAAGSRTSRARRPTLSMLSGRNTDLGSVSHQEDARRTVKDVEAVSQRLRIVDVQRQQDGFVSAQGTAESLGIEESRVVKSLLFDVGGKPMMVVLSGSSKVDKSKLKTHLLSKRAPAFWRNGDLGSTAAERAQDTADARDFQNAAAYLGLRNEKLGVQLTEPSMAVKLTGYQIGTIPPFGHACEFPTIVDQEILSHGTVFAGCGAFGKQMQINVADLIMVSKAWVLDIAVAAKPEPVSPIPYAAYVAANTALDRQYSATGTDSLPNRNESSSATILNNQKTTGGENSSQGVLQLSEPISYEMLRGGYSFDERAAQKRSPLKTKLLYYEEKGSRPWVELECTVVSRHKIGKRLLFAFIVPLGVEAADKESCTAWTWASDCKALCQEDPFRMQLILGKTITSNVGEPAIDKVMKGIKPGVTLRVSGVLQGQMGRTSNPRSDQLDLVVHNLTFLGRPLEGNLVGSSSRGSTAKGHQKENSEGNFPQLPLDNIVFVNNGQDLESSLQILLDRMTSWVDSGGVRALGIDAEWVPKEFLEHGEDVQNVCILQISTGDFAVVVDMSCWSDSVECLDMILGPVLLDQSILKLGFGLRQDISMLMKTFPQITCFHALNELVNSYLGFAELKDMSMMHTRGPKSFGAGSSTTIGLSRSCQQILGGAMDKSMQTSNWRLRPISPSQLRYAATDAQILVLLYEQLGSRVAEASRKAALKCADKLRQKKGRHPKGGQKTQRSKVRNSIDDEPKVGPYETSVGEGSDVDADVPAMIRRNTIGRTCLNKGKAAVIQEMVGAGQEASVLPRNEAGFVEWPSAVALFVNIGHGRFANEFSEDGSSFAWYGSRRQLRDSPILRSFLVEHGAKNGVDVDAVLSDISTTGSSISLAHGTAGVQDPASTEVTGQYVVLFCRARNQPYVFYGRLSILSVELDSWPAKIVWRLCDYEALKESIYFKDQLRAAHDFSAKRQGPYQSQWTYE